MGAWMDINGESIYGTDASPFFKLTWGRCTRRDIRNGTLLYLHVFQWPESGILNVPGISADIKRISLLAEPGRKLPFQFEEGNLLIELPETMPDRVNTVVVVKVKGEPEIENNMPVLKEGNVLLTADFAEIRNPGYGTHALLSGSGTESLVTNWVDPRVRLRWVFNATEPGTYAVSAVVRTETLCKLRVEIGEHGEVTDVPPTGGTLTKVPLCHIEISEPGIAILTLRAVPEVWDGMDLGTVTLQKQ
jgi:alpha-L-fucosidase